MAPASVDFPKCLVFSLPNGMSLSVIGQMYDICSPEFGRLRFSLSMNIRWRL